VSLQTTSQYECLSFCHPILDGVYQLCTQERSVHIGYATSPREPVSCTLCSKLATYSLSYISHL